jgi:hypothetical protein
MNKERILQLADFIENGKAVEADLGFNMTDFWEPQAHALSEDKSGHDCGTVACIAGHALFLTGKATVGKPKTVPSVAIEAARWLGLEDMGEMNEVADQLFYGWSPGDQYVRGLYAVDMSRVTPADAAKVLRNLAETGKVDWTIIGKGV